MSKTLLSIDVIGDGPDLVFRLDGELDIASAGTLRACLDSIDAGCRRVILDLSELRYMDSSGIGVLVEAYQKLQPDLRGLVLRSPQRTVQRVLELSGLGSVIKIEDDGLPP
jgi:anti-anti-sigma factor